MEGKNGAGGVAQDKMAAGMNSDSFEVNVKDFQGRSVVIKVDPTWDVSRIKQEITRQTGVPPSDFRIVFAGQTLADTQTLFVSVAVHSHSHMSVTHSCKPLLCVHEMHG